MTGTGTRLGSVYPIEPERPLSCLSSDRPLSVVGFSSCCFRLLDLKRCGVRLRLSLDGADGPEFIGVSVDGRAYWIGGKARLIAEGQLRVVESRLREVDGEEQDGDGLEVGSNDAVSVLYEATVSKVIV